uniref:Uncharacterized protein n=1 Tax=Ciona intestinalis TaxID=7719 RepID=H2XRT8_CIOIN
MSQRDERNVCELWKELKLKKSFNENLNTGDISKGVRYLTVLSLMGQMLNILFMLYSVASNDK